MSTASDTGTGGREGDTSGAAAHVVFGAGPVGRAIARELSDRGTRVRLVNRSGGPSARRARRGGGRRRRRAAFVREACAGAEVVYECLNPGWRHWPTLFPRLQTSLLEGAAASGARYVSFENLWMYGRSHGRPLTEDLPHAPEGPNAAARAHMAEELLEAHRAGKVRVAIGRASELFGPGVLGSLMGERSSRLPWRAGRPRSPAIPTRPTPTRMCPISVGSS